MRMYVYNETKGQISCPFFPVGGEDEGRGGEGDRRDRAGLPPLDLEVALAPGELADLCVVRPGLRSDLAQHADHLLIALGE